MKMPYKPIPSLPLYVHGSVNLNLTVTVTLHIHPFKLSNVTNVCQAVSLFCHIISPVF